MILSHDVTFSFPTRPCRKRFLDEVCLFLALAVGKQPVKSGEENGNMVFVGNNATISIVMAECANSKDERFRAIFTTTTQSNLSRVNSQDVDAEAICDAASIILHLHRKLALIHRSHMTDYAAYREAGRI